MGHTTFLLISILFLLNVQPSSPSSIGLNLVNTLRRKLLQVATTFTTLTPDNTHLQLCDTDLCDSKRPDGPGKEGLCNRWARDVLPRTEQCPEEQIFHVQGDPGTNDKAEMFFNLRSPWNVACEKGTCTPSLGAVYNVYVAEGCIPERDYISEMQDTSDRVSKQVKIYLRRKAEFYITVQRIPGIQTGPNSNCSFGLTVGSIEAQTDTAKCFGFRHVKRGDVDMANVPNCREVMPQYESFVQADTSAQATFVVALIGLGILVLALLVLGGVLLRRWSRRKAQKAKDIGFEGVQPGATSSLAVAAAERPSPVDTTVVVDVKPPEPREEEEPRRKQRAPGVRTIEDRKRLERRMMQIEDGADDDDVGEGELGANAGVLEGRGTSASIQLKQGRGGSKLIMGGGKTAGPASRPAGSGSSGSQNRSGSASSGSGSDAGRGSPADELYRSRLTARLVPGSPGGSRVPTPPEAAQGARGAAPRRAQGSRGSSVAGEDIEFNLKHRPGTASSSGSAAEWEDNTGIRIDDILAQARGAAAAAAGGKGTPDRSRAWRPGDPSPAPSGSGSSGLGRQIAASSSSGSGDGNANPAMSRHAQPPPPSAMPGSGNGAAGRPGRPPVMAPLMAARLGIKPQQAIGGRTMAPLGSNHPFSPGKAEVSATTVTTTTVMLQSVAPIRQVADLPVAGQAGVPLPPPRGNAALPPARALALNGNVNGRSNGGPLPLSGPAQSGPPAPGAAAWRTPTGTPTEGATRTRMQEAALGANARPPLGGGAQRNGMGANGRDGRGMARIGNGRGALEEHVLEEDD